MENRSKPRFDYVQKNQEEKVSIYKKCCVMGSLANGISQLLGSIFIVR